MMVIFFVSGISILRENTIIRCRLVIPWFSRSSMLQVAAARVCDDDYGIDEVVFCDVSFFFHAATIDLNVSD